MFINTLYIKAKGGSMVVFIFNQMSFMNQWVCTDAKALPILVHRCMKPHLRTHWAETSHADVPGVFFQLKFQDLQSDLCYFHCNGEIIRQHTYNALLSSCRTLACWKFLPRMSDHIVGVLWACTNQMLFFASGMRWQQTFGIIGSLHCNLAHRSVFIN